MLTKVMSRIRLVKRGLAPFDISPLLTFEADVDLLALLRRVRVAVEQHRLVHGDGAPLGLGVGEVEVAVAGGLLGLSHQKES